MYLLYFVAIHVRFKIPITIWFFVENTLELLFPFMEFDTLNDVYFVLLKWINFGKVKFKNLILTQFF